MKRSNLLILIAIVAQGCGQGADYIAVRNTGLGNVGGETLFQSSNNPDVFNNVPNHNSNDAPSAEAPYEFPMDGRGPQSFSFTASANRVLKIRFYADMPDAMIRGTGMVANYGRLAANITVNGKRLSSGLISNGYQSARERSVVLDFSDVLLTNSNPAARSTVTITVSDPQSDTYCVIQGICSPRSQSVHPLHQWKAHLIVQTDDTSAI